MHLQAYQLDDEMRVLESPDGYTHFGLSRRVNVPSETLRNHVNAVREFRDGMEALLSEFTEEIDRQQHEIDKQIQHGEFFLREFKGNEWDANPMFDRLRLLYTSQIDTLMRERRQLRRDRIKHRMAFMKELLDANKELSPFSRFF